MQRSYQPSLLARRAMLVMLFGMSTGQAVASEPDSSDLPDGELLAQVDHRLRAFEGFLRVDVTNTLDRARQMMSARPDEAESILAVLLDKVRRAGDIDANLRAQVVNRIEAAQRLARRETQAHAGRLAQQGAAQWSTRKRPVRDVSLEPASITQSVSQFNELMAERRYRDAEALASMAQESNPGNPVFRNAILSARMAGNTADTKTLRTMRDKGVVDAWYQEELYSIPTVTQQPILFPDREAWQLRTNQRKKKHAVDVKPYSANELKILDALDEVTQFDFVDQPLKDVVDYFKARHGIEIQLDKRALADEGINESVTITRRVSDIPLRSALKLLLRDVDLTYVIRYDVLLITSKTEADSMREVRVYPVADLVDQNPYRRRAARHFGISRMNRATAAGFGAF